jgi:CDP-diacylglycerol--glycerol-3-phosphate 3-phosphatidyltransferase
MVIIALAIITALYDLAWPVTVPVVLIILREVLISGLREFLGEVKLEVTRVAKWKTSLQMFAICLLLVRGALLPAPAAEPARSAVGKMMEDVGTGAGALGLALLWIAAWVTLVTGFDYFRKGLPHLRDKEADSPTLAATLAAQAKD